jgi:hypothetical protein
MPRPRVPPKNRIRAYRACDPCKASKTRCDSQLPCAACNKPSRVVQCTYGTPTPPGNRTARNHGRWSNSRQSAQSHQRPVGSPESRQIAPALATSPSCPLESDVRTEMDITLHADVATAEEDNQESPQEQVVTGPNGEKRKSQCGQ